MRCSIIIPEKDIASMAIYESLRKERLPEGVEIRRFDNESLLLDDVDKEVEGDILLFATRHKSESGKKSYTCHFPGNWSEAEFGGRSRQLCIAPASFMKEAFRCLNSNASSTGFEVTLEATHHGPYLSKKPAMFIELGSSEHEWKDVAAGKVIAKSIAEALSKEIPSRKTYIGFGGTHYPHDFTRIVLESDLAIGHICPKYQLGNLDQEMAQQAMSRNLGECSGAILDWKGLGNEKGRLLHLLSSLNINYMKSSAVLKAQQKAL